MPQFAGFPDATFSYLADLAAHNDRDWFEANKARYQADCIAPALDYIAALAPVAAALNPPHIAQPKMNGSLRRLHRDLRFSPDKTPYSPRLHLVFWSGDHPNRAPALHLVLRADSFGLGVGQWGWTPAQLAAYRAALLQPGARDSLKAAIISAEAVGCELEPPSLKRLPKDCASIGVDDDLLLRKSLVVRNQTTLAIPTQLRDDNAVAYTAKVFTALLPVSAWIKNHIL